MQRRQPSGWMRAWGLWPALGLAFALPCLLAPWIGPIANAGEQDLPRAFSRTWCVFTTPHFTFTTDLPRRRALAKIRELDRFSQLFAKLFPGAEGRIGLPLRMLAFRRARDFNEVTGSELYAGITVPALRGYQLLIGPGQGGSVTDTSVHEYAHYLLRNQTRRHYPLWYEEGLASYLSTAKLVRGRFLLGYLDPHMVSDRSLGQRLTFANVVQATNISAWSQPELGEFYEKSWLLVHFLRLGHQADEYPDLRAALHGYLQQPELGFTTAFGLSPARLGEMVQDYRRRHRFGEKVELPKTDLQEVRRVCLDAVASRLQLAAGVISINPELAARALIAPNDGPNADRLTILSLALTKLDPKQALAAVKQALAGAPNHPGAIVQHADLITRGCGLSSDPACISAWARATEALARAWRLDPQRYDAAYGLGVAYLHTGRAQQAIAHLRIAWEKMPWSVQTNFFLGEAYRIIGDARAREHLRRARNWAQDAIWQARAETALARLD